MPEDLQNGDGFGYIIAFRPLGEVNWTHAVTSIPSQSRYVYRNESIPPFSPFSIKVGAYNTKGQGPFSPVTIVFSAENGETVSRIMSTAQKLTFSVIYSVFNGFFFPLCIYSSIVRSKKIFKEQPGIDSFTIIALLCAALKEHGSFL